MSFFGLFKKSEPSISPVCANCSNFSALVKLVESPEGTRLIYSGPGGSNGNIGDVISQQRVSAIRNAFTPPYANSKLLAAEFYDGAGFCDTCKVFYCSTHWDVASTGGGKCPKGHFKSLDPHWSPE